MNNQDAPFTEGDVRSNGIGSQIISQLNALNEMQQGLSSILASVPVPQLTHKYIVGAESDLWGHPDYSGYAPWYPFAIGAGTFAPGIGNDNHPGIALFSSAAVANTGAYIAGWQQAILIAGGERATFVFQLINTNAAILSRFGFMDVFNNAAPVDGIWLDVNNITLTGKTSNNTVTSTTASSYAALATGTWYRGEIEVNDDATLVTFYLYDCATQALLWSDTLAANIPTAAGRETGHAACAYRTTAVATNLIYLDYLSFICTRPLTR